MMASAAVVGSVTIAVAAAGAAVDLEANALCCGLAAGAHQAFASAIPGVQELHASAISQWDGMVCRDNYHGAADLHHQDCGVVSGSWLCTHHLTVHLMHRFQLYRNVALG